MGYKSSEATTVSAGVQRNVTDNEAKAYVLTSGKVLPSNNTPVFASPPAIGTTVPNTISATQLDINIGAAGDPKVIFDINGTDKFCIGVDDSDSDILKICTGSAVGTTTLLEISSNGIVSGDSAAFTMNKLVCAATYTTAVPISGSKTSVININGVLAQWLIFANGDNSTAWFWHGFCLVGDDGVTENLIRLDPVGGYLTLTIDANGFIVCNNSHTSFAQDISINTLRLN